MWHIIIRAKLIKMMLVGCIALGVMAYPYLAGLVSTEAPRGKIVLIIDDFGNHADGTKAMMALGIPLATAVMPFLPYTEEEAHMIHDAGLEVLMHVPMEPEHGDPSWLGARGITTDLSNTEIEDRIREGLAQMPQAVGLNNHMGSRATQDRRVMRAVLQVAAQQNLFFIDSKTTPHSVVGEVADEMGVPHLVRDVFLDGIQDRAHIEAQLEKLGDIALEKGYAVGIGHVGIEGGTVTADALGAMIPVLKERGIEFVFPSQLIRDGPTPPR